MSRDERTRELFVQIYGVQRSLGSIPTALHCDVRTTVLALLREVNGRGKAIALSADRAAAVDAALQAGGEPAAMGVQTLRAQIATWKREMRGEADAAGINQYYDAYRASGYTAAMAGPQEALSVRCMELAALPRAGASSLVLDLGCGSGLSTLPLAQRGCTPIGVDLSLAMLLAARKAGAEVVQADVSRPLPFRPGLFDGVTSVSTIQFLCEPAGGRTASERLRCCFDETRRVLLPPSAGVASAVAGFQFHPDDAEAHPELIARAARAAGFRAALVVDQPHHTSARRWFLCAASVAACDIEHSAGRGVGFAPPCCCGMHAPLRACCLLGLVTWPPPHGIEPPPRPSADHLEWLRLEHARYAHRLLRVLRRLEATADADAVGDVGGGGSGSHQSGLAGSGAGGGAGGAASGVSTGEASSPTQRPAKKLKGAPELSSAELGMARRLRARLQRRAVNGGTAATGTSTGTSTSGASCTPTLEELHDRVDEVIAALHEVDTSMPPPEQEALALY